MDQSDTGSAGIFSRWTSPPHPPHVRPIQSQPRPQPQPGSRLASNNATRDPLVCPSQEAGSAVDLEPDTIRPRIYTHTRLGLRSWEVWYTQTQKMAAATAQRPDTPRAAYSNFPRALFPSYRNGEYGGVV
eukprot:3203763-Pyramimonas_sp.AAC.1